MRLILGFAAVLVAVMSFRFVLVAGDPSTAHMAHYSGLSPLAMTAHVLGAPLALLLAPLQLSDRVRNRAPTLHRMAGRVSALAVLVGVLGALGMLPYFLGSPFAASGFFVLALVWAGATAIGIWHIRHGRLTDHRVWMLRSVALSFSAVTLRVQMIPLVAAGWTIPETYSITAWACWVPNLLVVEWLRHRRRSVLA